MEVDWVCKRAHLRALLQLHPDWSKPQLADAVGCSKSLVTTWKKRFAEVDPHHVVVLFSRSRAPHHHPARLSEQVVERIIEMRLAPPDNLKRTPGPKALVYSLDRDETDAACVACACPGPPAPSGRSSTRPDSSSVPRSASVPPCPWPELLQEVQMDCKDVTTALPDPTSPLGKQHHLIEVCHFRDAGSSRLLICSSP
jgi:hypothetical protein